MSTKWIVKRIRLKYVTKNIFFFKLETDLVTSVHNPKFLLCWAYLMCYSSLSLQAGEESWAHRLQSDETSTEAQTPVSSFLLFLALPSTSLT